jgi:hypothetical protein
MHRTRFLKLLPAVLVVLFAGGTELRACSIPVFRYALERWVPDLYEIDVFFRGELPTDERAVIEALEEAAVANGGSANLEVVRCDIDGKLPQDLAELAGQLGDVSPPHVVVRLPLAGGVRAVVWQGPLAEFSATDLADSPARGAICKRLLEGDSVLWLIVGDAENESVKNARQLLDKLLPQLAEETPLPAGVGAPGSELASRIPLEVKFSTIPVDSGKAEETWLARMLASQAPAKSEPGEPLVAAVFGRGRVVEVFRAADIDEQLIGDVSRFLCGACSCQVKQLNPGFDLLTSTFWDEQLYGDGEPPAIEPHAAVATIDPNAPPALVAIPPGVVQAADGNQTNGDDVNSAESHASPTANSTTTSLMKAYRWPALATAAVALVLVAMVCMLRRN